MRILLLCNKPPYPPKEGGPIAMNAIVEGLINAGHDVKVVAVNTNKYFVDPENIPAEYRIKTGIETVYIDLSIKPLDAFFNLFTSKSYHVQRFITKELKLKLTEILTNQEFDIVQLEMLYMAPYIDIIRKFSKAKIVLRAHNIEHLIWKRIAENCKNPLKRFYLNHLYKTLKLFELETVKKCDGIAAITRNDADFFIKTGINTPIIDIPFGISPDMKQMPDITPEIPSLFHIGSMNWYPNEEGIRWFLDNAWPLIHEKFPGLNFYLAGRMMPEWLENSNIPNVKIIGEVKDALDFMRSKWIMIVPLFSGSGIRIKIIEGMAAERTIISTTIGAEGINYKDENNIIIADTKEAYLDAVSKCIDQPGYCNSIGKNARQLILNDHNNDLLMNRLTKFYHEISSS